jgi:hypothetical protein
MPCSCSAGACTSCACGKAGRVCSPSCHGGSNEYCMNDAIGKKVNNVPIAEVRKLLGAAGGDIIGNQAELKLRLAKHMREQHVSESTATSNAQPASSSSSSSSSSLPASNASVIKNVLECADDYASLLSLSGVTVTASSSQTELRRAYLRLSLKVHPDKNNSSLESRQAFQLLVSALERINQAPGGEDEGSGRGGRGDAPRAPRERVDTSISRSNAGCVQTRILCPKCKMDWPRKELGLEDAAYNFFMMALKSYTCGLCMLDFGCMTAIHQCPHCRKTYDDYTPGDYHRKRVCGNPGCDKEFGYFQHPVSSRRIAEVKKELAQLQEERMRRADARARREGRMKQRDAPVSSSSSSSSTTKTVDPESLFKLELSDECPRCGLFMHRDSEQTHAEHLASCNDKKAQAAHKEVLKARAAKIAAVASKAELADDAAALARWEAGGRVVGNVWMLPERVLVKLCTSAGLASTGNKVELVRRLADHLREEARRGGMLRLMDDPSAKTSVSRGGGGGGGSRNRVDAADIADLDAHEMPSNLHSLDTEQLAAVCAAFGLSGDAKSGKETLIKILERARFKDRLEDVGLSAVAMLEDEEDEEGGRGGGGRKKLEDKSQGGKKSKRSRDDDDDDEVFELDEDDDEDQDASLGHKKKR